jgi:hypothetical protein
MSCQVFWQKTDHFSIMVAGLGVAAAAAAAAAAAGRQYTTVPVLLIRWCCEAL